MLLVAADGDSVDFSPQVDEPVDDPMFLDDTTKGDIPWSSVSLINLFS